MRGGERAALVRVKEVLDGKEERPLGGRSLGRAPIGRIRSNGVPGASALYNEIAEKIRKLQGRK